MRFKLGPIIIILAMISYNLGGIFLTFTSFQPTYLSPGNEVINGNSKIIPIIFLLITATTLILLTMSKIKGRSKNEK